MIKEVLTHNNSNIGISYWQDADTTKKTEEVIPPNMKMTRDKKLTNTKSITLQKPRTKTMVIRTMKALYFA